jgi:hypothetical protein
VTNVGPSLASLDAIAFQPIPEPGTLALLAAGLAAMAVIRRRRR